MQTLELCYSGGTKLWETHMQNIFTNVKKENIKRTKKKKSFKDSCLFSKTFQGTDCFSSKYFKVP